MAITVQQVFDQAIHLMDEQNENTGATVTVDTKEYKSRTISILNTAIARLYPYSATYDRNNSRRKVKTLSCDNYAEPDFEQTVPLDDTMCLGLLPYYLAAQLLSGENETLAAWFMNLYREAFADIRRTYPAEFEQISTPYGLF